MVQNEKAWRRGRRNNRICLGLGLLALLIAPWVANRFDIDVSLLTGPAMGLLGVGVVFEIWLFRKPSQPAQDTIDKLERESIPVMLISTIATWGFLICALIASNLDERSPFFWPIFSLGGLLILIAIALLPRLLSHMRYSRVAPELHDERSQSNFDKAYRQSFLVMFQMSFLGGIVLMWDVVSVPAEYVALGIGLVGIITVSLLWCWYDWRDSR